MANRLRDTKDVVRFPDRGGAATAKVPKNLQSTGAWRAVEEEFLATGQAAPVELALTKARDEFVVEAYRTAIAPVFPDSVAMLAGGAYALGQTFPYSELDIVLLLDTGKQSNALKELLPEFVRLLWNAGLRVSCTVLTVAECLEAVEQAGVLGFTLLDRRFLAGDAAVAGKLETRLPAVVALHGPKMCQHLCEVARARHARYRNTPYHAEPDVKEGPGGIEDVRLMDWLAMLRTEHEGPGGELTRAAAFVSSARCFLHYCAGCDHNVLDFEVQADLAHHAFARVPAEWMRRYFQSARTIFNEARRALEGAEKSQSSLLDNFREYRSRLSNQEFTVSRERLLLRNPAQLATDPALVLRMLEFIARHGVAPAAETERRLEASRDGFAAWCAQPQPVWAALKTTLACPHAAMALRSLEATGLMRALFPEWGAIEHLVIADSEYPYTVGEDALEAVECVIELGSTAGLVEGGVNGAANGATHSPERTRFAGLLSELDDVAVLLFALLFHDMGRGAADPVRLAAERAGQAMARIGMPEDVQGTVEFLILHQSDLSGALTGRDMDDPAEAASLAGRVGTIERLKLLSVMTYAEIVLLGAKADTRWRLEQLWRAYSIGQHELLRELETDRIRQVPENLPENAEFIKGFPLRYLRAHPSAEIAEHLKLFELSRPTGVAVQLGPMEGAYRLTVVARDKPSLFAQFAGAISSFGLDILKAEAFSNAAGVILDTFVFADPKRMLQQNPSEADRLGDMVRRVALGKTDAHRLMRGRGLPDATRGPVSPQVEFDSEACPTATLVEIKTEDRPGLLYSLATVFSSSACNIDVVLVDTKGHRAIDVFYVAHDGRKLSLEMQERLKEKLLAVC
jgi:[protein-PII] uridylyltransferase